MTTILENSLAKATETLGMIKSLSFDDPRRADLFDDLDRIHADAKQRGIPELLRISAAKNGGVPHLYLVTADKGVDSVDLDEAKRRGFIKTYVPKAPPQHVDPVAALNAGVTMDRYFKREED